MKPNKSSSSVEETWDEYSTSSCVDDLTEVENGHSNRQNSVFEFSESTEKKTNIPKTKSTLSLQSYLDRIPKQKLKPCLALVQTVLFFYAYIAVGFLNAISGPMLTHLQKLTGTTENDIGWILTTKGIGMVVGTPISGFLYSLFKKSKGEKKKWYKPSLNRILTVFLVSMAASICVVPFFPSFVAQLIVHFFQGVFSAGVEVGGNLGIAWVWRDKVGPFLQAIHCFASIGSYVFPLIQAQIFTFVEAEQVQMYLSYVLCTILILVIVVPLFLIQSPNCPGDEHLRTERSPTNFKSYCLHLMKKLFSVNTFIYIQLGYIKGVSTGGYSTFGNLIMQSCQRKKIASDITLAYLTSGFWASFAIGRFFSIFICLLVNPSVMLSTSLGMTVVAYCVMNMNTSNIYFISIGTILHGLFTAPISALSMGIAQLSFNIPLNPTSTSVIMFGSMTGEMMIPTLVQIVNPFFEENSVLYVLLVLFASSFFVYFLLYLVGKLNLFYRKKKGRNLANRRIENTMEVLGDEELL